MTRLKFAIMLKEDGFERFKIEPYPNLGYYLICLGGPECSKKCKHRRECNTLHGSTRPRLDWFEFQEFLDLYPELRIMTALEKFEKVYRAGKLPDISLEDHSFCLSDGTCTGCVFRCYNNTDAACEIGGPEEHIFREEDLEEFLDKYPEARIIL